MAWAGAAAEVDHAAYDSFLKQYTRDGLVDYDAIKKNLSGLEAYLEMLSDSSAVHYKAWGRESKTAFWINAYNALTIYAVATNYPINPAEPVSRKRFPENSIGQVKDVWDTAYVNLAGRPVTLNEIEHDILRKEFWDPRINFALVRASRGGPLLSDAAYHGATLDEHLEHDAVRFVNDYDKVRVKVTGGKLYVSELFDWQADDFLVAEEAPVWLEAYKTKMRGLLSFIAPRVDKQTRSAIEKGNLKIIYLDYDWSLNDLVEKD